MARRRITVADVKEILVWWDAGEGVGAIAQRLGYTRMTVRKYVRAAEQEGMQRGGGRRGEAAWDRLTAAALGRVAPRHPPRPAACEVAQYHSYLEPRVGTLPLTVLHQRLRDEQGLHASWRSFHRYVAAHWPEKLRHAAQVTIRRDDPPAGEEAQVDFFYVGLWDDPESGRRHKLYAFLMTLSHSRHQFLYPCLAEDAAAWQAGHVGAFTFFGGAPRRLIPDNLSAGIQKADLYDPRLNRAYGELTRHYGCLVDPARVQRPKDKARVERGVPYARTSFFADRTWPSLAAMRAAAEEWCLTTAGLRTPGTTGEEPLLAFRDREQAALGPLPAQPWEQATWTSGRVQADCHLRAGGASYSAPYPYVGQRLDVRLGERVVTLYEGATAVTTHARKPHGRATHPEHYPPAGQAFLVGTPATCLAQAQALGPATGTLVGALLAPATLTRLREVQALLRLRETYPAARIEAACARAVASGDGRYRTVRGLLAHDLDSVLPEDTPPPPVTRAFLRGPAAFGAVSPAAEVSA